MATSTFQPPAVATRSRAVSGIAWGFILFATLVAGLLGLLLLPGEPLTAMLAVEPGSGGLTGGVAWLLARSRMLTGLLLAGALLTLILAIALLRRRPWARGAFLALLALGFVAVLGAAALTPLTFSLLPESATSGTPGTELTGMLGTLIVIATLLAVLFAWAGWRLATPAVRAEFDRGRSA
ncbi:hypothetical protein EQG41_06440 [Billgrantia azerbaijanica]|nr:hypothetical protein EQG41_06440 [Halomonas azerbaijanica]